MQTGYKVIDIMTNKPVIASRDMSLKDAAQLMHKENINSLIIVENDIPMGIVTDEDFVRKCIAKGLDSKKLKIRDIISTDLLTISPDVDISEALKMMTNHGIRQLPVVDEKKFVGFLTMKDILKIQPDLIDLVAEKYEIREESRKLRELEKMAEDDGSSFFSKLKLRKKRR